MNSRRKICRGFFDAYRTRSAALLILQAGRRLTEVPPPLVAKATELGRAAGKAAAGWVFDGNTPEVLCTFSSHATIEPISEDTGGTPAAVTHGGGGADMLALERVIWARLAGAVGWVTCR